MKIYCCEEHVELALDIIVDECEAAPILQKLDGFPQMKCGYCEKEAIYLVDSE